MGGIEMVKEFRRKRGRQPKDRNNSEEGTALKGMTEE